MCGLYNLIHGMTFRSELYLILLWNKYTTMHIMLCNMFQQNTVGKELCCTHSMSQESV